jgi:metal-responsive CopG/Arc/MetJ family transcriptional regulator
MGYSKISVTIPDEMYNDMKEFTLREKIKISHLVAEAIADKLRKIKEERFIQQVNEVFKDPEVGKEQRLMAEAIADNADLEELPW